MAYEETLRKAAIAGCDVWLGLGGSPFQCSVSRWFTDHLEQERRWCVELGKPMYFLGVGGQDPSAYLLPETGLLCRQAKRIWTRDTVTAEALTHAVPEARVQAAADLAHVWLEKATRRKAAKGRLVGVFNFDYGTWEGMAEVLKALHSLPAQERIWLRRKHGPCRVPSWSCLSACRLRRKGDGSWS